MVQSSVFRLSFLAESSHGRRLQLEEVLLFMTISKHAHFRLAATEEDRRLLIMDPLVVEDIALRHSPDEAHRQGSMEVVQLREIVIWTLTGHAHSPVQVHAEHAHGPIHPDRGPGLPHVEAVPMDVEIALRHREVGEEEGVLATLAFPATAIGAVAEVEVGMDAVGANMQSLNQLIRSSMADIEISHCTRDIIPRHERPYWRFWRISGIEPPIGYESHIPYVEAHACGGKLYLEC